MKRTKLYIRFTWFAVLALLLFVSGCSTKKSVSESIERTKDSISLKTTIIPKDTIINVPSNFASVASDIDKITSKPIQSTSKNLTASLRREGNTIIAECNQEQLELIISLQEKLIESYRSKETLLQDSIKIQKSPWYLTPLLWLCAISFLANIIFLAIYLLKKISKTSLKNGTI